MLRLFLPYFSFESIDIKTSLKVLKGFLRDPDPDQTKNLNLDPTKHLNPDPTKRSGTD